MNKKIWQALVSVSSVSADAKKLSKDLMTQYSPELVQQLYDKNAELERQIATLTQQVEPEIAQEELDELAAQFKQLLRNHPAEDLINYNHAYLRPYPGPVRVVLCTQLKNRAVELEVAPLDVWSDVIALGGELV